MIAAVTMVRNEADVIEGTMRHMADEGVDLIVVADNLSTDNTRDILESLELPCELVIEDDPEPGYYQSEKMTRLAHFAGERGADWVIPFDADELWTAEQRLSDWLRELPPSCRSVAAKVFTFSPTGDDPPARDPMLRIQYRHRDPLEMRKAAFRFQQGAVIAPGNHSVRLPKPGAVDESVSVWHYPYRTPEQFVRKAKQGADACRAAGLPESTCAHWRGYANIAAAQGDEACADIYREWFSFPTSDGMVHDPFVYRRWKRQNVVVISPHLDDGVLSCGAMLAARPGNTTVITVCAGIPETGLTGYDEQCGFPTSEAAVRTRRLEDQQAAGIIGARPIHLDFLDSQYGATDWVQAAKAIRDNIPAGETIVCVPLGIGHPDHEACTRAALDAVAGLPVTVLLYEELPYRVLRPDTAVAAAATRGGWLRPMEQDRAAKVDAVDAYVSQMWALDRDCLLVPERYWQCD